MRVTLMVLLAFTRPIAADDWARAEVAYVFSQNGSRFVRTVPGQSIGETFGFAGAPKGEWARAEFYARQRDRSYALVAESALRNPVAPVVALVGDDGGLITFDNWHNAGYGDVVAIYDGTGKLIRSYRLEDLYSADEIRKVETSVSSRWWRRHAPRFVDEKTQKAVFVTDFRGGEFVFDLRDGAFTYRPAAVK